jgi:hypothetical protein
LTQRTEIHWLIALSLEIFTGAAHDPHYQQREVAKTGNQVAHGKMTQ